MTDNVSVSRAQLPHPLPSSATEPSIKWRTRGGSRMGPRVKPEDGGRGGGAR